jgi:formate dehydrogenase major subunit
MRPGCGAYPLRGHNNVQGASDMGAMPDNFPGYQSVHDGEVRQKFERCWGVSIPTTRGKNNHEMMAATATGAFRGLYLAGEDMISADSNSSRVAAAFAKLDFFVVQEVFFSETCRYADVVLPAAPALEKDGTLTNTERRVQRLYQALPELGDSKADWKIVEMLARRMGAAWNYSHPSEIMAELASVTPIYAGVRYDRLEGYQTLQWPVDAEGRDQPILYLNGFPFPDKKARLHPVQFHEPQEQPDEEFDLFLNNGRLLEHFHEGDLTHRVPHIHQETPERFLEVSPELASERNIVSGRWLRVVSRHGAVKVKALVSERVFGNQVFLPLSSLEGPINILTGSHMDPVTDTPAYKETAVKIELLPETGTNPLLPLNFRYSGKPTPQTGVEVERKWKRADYRMPGSQTLVRIQPAQ